MIDAAQMKAGRALIGMDQKELAEKSGVSLPTIQRMEKLGTARSNAGNVASVQRALESAGVVFIPENGGGAGVRLKKE
ncbi:helix-turn-helix transcriptional regulator [Rhodospirillaceae bacterium KN72]|uniref:Helix-turn-helix transcriptional regulator n=1 Tax=Pacificispira spongiicola TaxID=2729598 RepID=A0A7Y0HHC1_9PROT|nr:helix-turn-helix transcriptional regulator [Pacificispira spongiicola]NMM46568.1 helix-turn-helix transcriptional regulator [Pacificispira spongiicola]